MRLMKTKGKRIVPGALKITSFIVHNQKQYGSRFSKTENAQLEFNGGNCTCPTRWSVGNTLDAIALGTNHIRFVISTPHKRYDNLTNILLHFGRITVTSLQIDYPVVYTLAMQWTIKWTVRPINRLMSTNQHSLALKGIDQSAFTRRWRYWPNSIHSSLKVLTNQHSLTLEGIDQSAFTRPWRYWPISIHSPLKLLPNLHSLALEGIDHQHSLALEGIDQSPICNYCLIYYNQKPNGLNLQ